MKIYSRIWRWVKGYLGWENVWCTSVVIGALASFITAAVGCPKADNQWRYSPWWTLWVGLMPFVFQWGGLIEILVRLCLWPFVESSKEISKALRALVKKLMQHLESRRARDLYSGRIVESEIDDFQTASAGLTAELVSEICHEFFSDQLNRALQPDEHVRVVFNDAFSSTDVGVLAILQKWTHRANRAGRIRDKQESVAVGLRLRLFPESGVARLEYQLSFSGSTELSRMVSEFKENIALSRARDDARTKIFEPSRYRENVALAEEGLQLLEAAKSSSTEKPRSIRVGLND